MPLYPNTSLRAALLHLGRAGCLGVVLTGAAVAPAVGQHAHHGAASAVSECNEPVLRCATKVTPAVAADGTVWLAFAAAGKVLVVHSTGDAARFGTPVAVTPAAGDLDWGPDARPKIAIDGKGNVHVAYAVFKDKHFNGQVFHSISKDGGLSFSAPQPMTNVQESQRFEVLAFDPAGRLFAAWLDKRNRVPAKARGERYPGAALAFTWLGADGNPGETRLAKDNTCECCRIGVAFAGPGRPVAIFRNIFDGGVRDHAVLTFSDADTPGPVHRVAVDEWKTHACPHHGPALAIGSDGAYHAVWYTSGAKRKGLFYARSADQGASFSEPLGLGAAGRNPSRPDLLAVADRLHLVWKEFDGVQTSILGQVSLDHGRSWSKPRPIATGQGETDHPLLVRRGSQVLLSWLTQGEGYRLIEVEPGT